MPEIRDIQRINQTGRHKSELSSVRYRNSILDENMKIIISYSDGYQIFCS